MKRFDIIAAIVITIILVGGAIMAMQGKGPSNDKLSVAETVQNAVTARARDNQNTDSYLSMRMSDIVTTEPALKIEPKKPELIVDIPADLLGEEAKVEELRPDPISEIIPEVAEPVTTPAPAPEPIPVVSSGKAKIVIIIDDMGQDRVHTKQTVALPGPLTLSYLPYSEGIREEVAQGKAAGHEIMLHMPMQPVADTSLGRAPYVLRVDMDDATLKSVYEKNMAAFDGYVGINNHMGSRATQDRRIMTMVMQDLKQRGLFFVDSLTIGSSVAGRVASEQGIPHATRDVFLDDNPSLSSVRSALQTLEQHARIHGTAIAIGHPKKDTIIALREWLPTLQGKGFELVPASQVVKITPPPSAPAAAPVAIDQSPFPPLE